MNFETKYNLGDKVQLEGGSVVNISRIHVEQSILDREPVTKYDCNMGDNYAYGIVDEQIKGRCVVTLVDDGPTPASITIPQGSGIGEGSLV